METNKLMLREVIGFTAYLLFISFLLYFVVNVNDWVQLIVSFVVAVVVMVIMLVVVYADYDIIYGFWHVKK